MRIIVTGGLGFIFSHVTEYLLAAGHNVHVFDNMSAGSHPELLPELQKNPAFTFHQIDVADQGVPNMIRNIHPDWIVHAAAISDVDTSIQDPFMTIYKNHRATMNVFEAARLMPGIQKLLYVSTDEVYGECDHPKEEHEIIWPKNPYSLSKAMGSLMRIAYDNTYAELKDKTCETRFCNVFGDRQDARKVIPAIIRAANGGEPLAVHNEGKGFRQYIHVSEIPPLVLQILERGDRTYNITSGEGFTVKELVEMAGEILGRPVPTIPAKRAGMDVRYEMSSKRIEKEFGWKPSVPFKEIFAKYLHENIH